MQAGSHWRPGPAHHACPLRLASLAIEMSSGREPVGDHKSAADERSGKREAFLRRSLTTKQRWVISKNSGGNHLAYGSGRPSRPSAPVIPHDRYKCSSPQQPCLLDPIPICSHCSYPLFLLLQLLWSSVCVAARIANKTIIGPQQSTAQRPLHLFLPQYLLVLRLPIHDLENQNPRNR